ncbi:MAG: NAD(P)H-hydrate dehydratase [Phycisphaerales bacterium]
MSGARPLPALPARDPAGHKGTFGTVCVIGGHAAEPTVMLGSVVLASLGALRAGAALCIAAAPEPLVPAILAANPSATGLPLPVDGEGRLVPHAVAAAIDAHAGRAGALVIGPGLGTGFAESQVTMRVLSTDDGRPVVVDADAINNLAATPQFDLDLRAPMVLTPHPGEFARLAEALRIHADPTDPVARPYAAERLAQRLGCVVALKGHGTVVSDGRETWTCRRGNDVLAVGGSGDVLAGVVAGIVVQHGRALGLYDCARLAVEAHAIAGERWAERAGGTAGMLAADLAAEIPAALASMRTLVFP